jgi:hypothetical protein
VQVSLHHASLTGGPKGRPVCPTLLPKDLRGTWGSRGGVRPGLWARLPTTHLLREWFPAAANLAVKDPEAPSHA